MKKSGSPKGFSSSSTMARLAFLAVVTLFAAACNGDGVTLGSGGPMETPGTIGASGASGTGASGATSSIKRVFVTLGNWNGASLGGLAGADAKCLIEANASNLGGTWRAWLSDSTTNAIDRINDVGPWYLVDGVTVVFANKAAISSSNPQVVIRNRDGTLPGGRVITATASSGLKKPGSFQGGYCTDWTASTGGSFFYGEPTLITNGWWTNSSWMDTCGNFGYALYCFEQ